MEAKFDFVCIPWGWFLEATMALGGRPVWMMSFCTKCHQENILKADAAPNSLNISIWIWGVG